MLATKETQETNQQENAICEILAEDLFLESAYGLEYIIDEIVSENTPAKNEIDDAVDWFGLYDLTI